MARPRSRSRTVGARFSYYLEPPNIKPEFGAQLLEHHLLKLGDNSISVKSRSKASPCWPSRRPPPCPGWAARGGIPLSLVHKEKVVRITLKSSPGSENKYLR